MHFAIFGSMRYLQRTPRQITYTICLTLVLIFAQVMPPVSSIVHAQSDRAAADDLLRIGTVTEGGVRDLDAMRGVGFFTFATTIMVSHAYIHMVELGVPVKIGDLWKGLEWHKVIWVSLS